jgi:hypothetical protein
MQGIAAKGTKNAKGKTESTEGHKEGQPIEYHPNFRLRFLCDLL